MQGFRIHWRGGSCLPTDMKDQEYEERRALNLIWNAAGSYALQPGYRAFDPDGRADLYFNSIIGSAYRCYAFAPLQKLFEAFRQEPDGDFYANLLWLGLENGVFLRERAGRPALASLREDYARKVIAQAPPEPDRDLYEGLRIAHFERALGQAPSLGRRETEILSLLEFDASMDAEAIVQQMRTLLKRYFWADPSAAERGWRRRGAGLLSRLGRHLSLRSASFGLRYVEPDTGNKSQDGGGQGEAPGFMQLGLHAQARRDKLRAYMESAFGRSLCSPREQQELEEHLCTGVHKGCLLHMTRGAFPPGEAVNGEAKEQREQSIRQRQLNRASFQRNRERNLQSIAALAGRLRNSLLLCQEDDQVLASSGRLAPERVWRLACLHDTRVFWKREPGEPGGMTVDILLDASASQRDHQEAVSAQAYIIAESLTRCQIPVRMYSFQSVSGCTVLHLFRDYGEVAKNEAVFDYTAAGWNRDGLALRAAGEMLKHVDSPHRLLILLSDASPNDDQKIAAQAGSLLQYSYEGRRAVADAADEVSRLRQEGIAVMCVFTGTERDLPAARSIYGNEVAQIRSVDQFADRVGGLILGQIRNF